MVCFALGMVSEAALKTFCAWFLKVALDQVTFSAKLFDLGSLDKRYRRLVSDTIDDKHAPDLVSAVLRHGALERGEAQFALKTSERTARNTLRQLTDAGFLASVSPKTPVRLAFPLEYRERLSPNLFTDADFSECFRRFARRTNSVTRLMSVTHRPPTPRPATVPCPASLAGSADQTQRGTSVSSHKYRVPLPSDCAARS